MTWYTLAELETRTADLRRDAARQRLARMATCCRPSTWARALRRVGDRLSRQQACCA